MTGKISDNPQLKARRTDDKIAGKLQEKVGQIEKAL
jgi:uncharacterized protein YjbJ (UPF0337 family)